MKKVIIYDFDGTLARTFDVHLSAYAYSLSKFGIKTTKKDIIQKCFNRIDGEVAGNFGIKNVRLFSKYYRTGLLLGLGKVKLYPNVINTLNLLKKLGFRIAIGTIRTSREMAVVFKTLSIKKYFETVVPYKKSNSKNPKLKIYATVCKNLKIKTNEATIIGDAASDIAASKKLGATSVLFYPKNHGGFYPLVTLKKLKPNYIISNHSEIKKII